MLIFSRILLVDDDPITNFINTTLLHKLKIASEVKAVTNVEEGIVCLSDHCYSFAKSPELIFLDINLPGKDGFDFMYEYNSLDFENKDKVLITVLTTSSRPDDRNRMEELGIRSFINKPLTEEKVRMLLQL